MKLDWLKPLPSKDLQHGPIQDGRKRHGRKSHSSWVIMALIYQSQGFRIYCSPFQMLWLRAYLCDPWLTCSMAGIMVPETLMMVLCWQGFTASVFIQQYLSLYLDFKWELPQVSFCIHNSSPCRENKETMCLAEEKARKCCALYI